MNKKKLTYTALAGVVVGGVVLTAPTMAEYRQAFKPVTQTITAATWDVEMGTNGQGWTKSGHTIFPGDEISQDTITLTNDNTYPVKFTINLTVDDTINKLDDVLALTLSVSKGDLSLDGKITNDLNGSTATITVPANTEVELLSKVTAEDFGIDLAVPGREHSVEYHYNVTASKTEQDTTGVVFKGNYTNLTEQQQALVMEQWLENNDLDKSVTYVKDKGLQATQGVFTRFDGYRTEGITHWTNKTVLDIAELQPLEGFDYSHAVNGINGEHKQDFIFHIYKDENGNVHVNADSNSTHKVPSHILGMEGTINLGMITELTLLHDFGVENGVFVANLSATSNTKSEGFTKTIISNHTPETIGGNRYGWLLAMGKNIEGQESAGLTNGVYITQSELRIEQAPVVLASNLTATRDYYDDRGDCVTIGFNLHEELNFNRVLESANIVVTYYDAEGNYVDHKDKTWEGYLNASSKEQLPQYSWTVLKDTIPADSYLNSTNPTNDTNLNIINKATKVEVTVTNNAGDITTLTADIINK